MRYVLVALFLLGCSSKAATSSNSTEATATAPAASGLASNGLASPSSAPAVSSKPKDPVVERMKKWKKAGVDIKDMKPIEDVLVIKEYEKNPIAGDAAHKGKPAALIGTIAEIGKDPDGPYVEMTGAKKDLADHRVRAYVDPDDADSMASLAKAEKGFGCTFACDMCKGWDDVMFVEFTGCAAECKKM